MTRHISNYAVCAAVVLMLPGCRWLNKPPIEETADRAIDKVLIPTARAVIESGAFSGQFQGSVQGINPEYVVKMKGHLVSGFEGEVRVGLNGVAGQVMGAGIAPKYDALKEVPATQPSQ